MALLCMSSQTHCAESANVNSAGPSDPPTNKITTVSLSTLHARRHYLGSSITS